MSNMDEHKSFEDLSVIDNVIINHLDDISNDILNIINKIDTNKILLSSLLSLDNEIGKINKEHPIIIQFYNLINDNPNTILHSLHTETYQFKCKVSTLKRQLSCPHVWIEDWIDINQEYSKRINYCELCELTR